ncbi:SOUL heme-binding protein [Halopelagius inordinatus]|uniref:SOUL heme-binding protein n=1 Tax=Halopelagius inordinatus TaxID=553467 RepID=A0A1I2NJJ0_9EURY|nr:heme-binding protein [Halopelagius inordinatus]SFG03982.1 SOUL heme-binding protein [Halopelagius inordinatus]
MVRTRALKWGVVAAASLGVGIAARSLYESRSTPDVPYETVGTLDGVELRRYPTAVVAETVAPSGNKAFRRLFRYIAGNNGSDAELSMTSPVATGDAARTARAPDGDDGESGADDAGETLPMTAPVETTRDADGVRMAFYLPESYDYESAPRPSDPNVRLVELPARTLAVKRFSWWATDRRVERQTDELLSTLRGDDAEVSVVGDPFLLRYDAPATPPFLRRNEVAVEVRRVASRSR